MIAKYLSFVTGFMYLVLGAVVIIYKFFLVALEDNVAYSLGGLFIVYGLFRIWRAYKRHKEIEDEE